MGGWIDIRQKSSACDRACARHTSKPLDGLASPPCGRLAPAQGRVVGSPLHRDATRSTARLTLTLANPDPNPDPDPDQGRNSIYNTDVSTVQIVGSYAQRFEHIMADFVAGVS